MPLGLRDTKVRVKARVICVGESKLVVGRELTEVGRARARERGRLRDAPAVRITHPLLERQERFSNFHSH